MKCLMITNLNLDQKIQSLFITQGIELEFLSFLDIEKDYPITKVEAVCFFLLEKENILKFIQNIRDKNPFLPISVYFTDTFYKLKEASFYFYRGVDFIADQNISFNYFVENLHHLMKKYFLLKEILEQKKASKLTKYFYIGSTKVLCSEYKLIKNEKEIALKNLEAKLLEFFYQNRGSILTRDEIRTYVWNRRYINPRTIDFHIVNIRKKLANDPKDLYLKTIFGVGYILV